MPLRADINAEILAWLSPASLRKLNATWRGRGFGHPDEIIEDMSMVAEGVKSSPSVLELARLRDEPAAGDPSQAADGAPSA